MIKGIFALLAGLTLTSSTFADAPVTVTPPPVSPIYIPVHAEPIDVGFRRRILPPIHIHPNLIVDPSGPNTDHPIVHPMLNMFQEDQKYANLFAENGVSEICGPAAMANMMLYLRFNHQPAFPKILERSEPVNATNGSYVETLFRLCRTDKNTGTFISDMRDCAIHALSEGGYSAANTFIRGMHSNIALQKFAPGPADLKVMSKSNYRPGSSATASDRGVVLLFGWYNVSWNKLTQKWVYQRVGGHYVALAGYDAINPNVFYVSNPLVDYNAPGFGDIRYSKITLERIPNQADISTPGGFQNVWQTRQLVGGSVAVLEDMVISLP